MIKNQSLNNSREDGFTLIEILVVILIIGILASIAIPVFLNQRKAANEGALRSDLRNIAIAVETHFSEEPNDVNVTFTDINFKASKGTTFALRGNANTWCAVGIHGNSAFNSTGDVTKALTYDSVNGGIMPNGWDWHAKSKCETSDTVWSWLYS